MSANARETLRRVAIWGSVVVFFAAMAWAITELGETTGLVSFFTFPVVGALILTSRPGNGVGRFLLGIGVFWAVVTPLLSGTMIALSMPWMETVWSALGWPLWGFLPAIGLIFPTGRTETRLGRIILWTLVSFVILATAATIVGPGPLPYSERENPLQLAAARPFVDVVLGVPGGACFLLLVLGIVVDLAIRWRRADGIRRLQYRWLFYALATTVAVVAVSGVLTLLMPDDVWLPTLLTVAGLVTNLIPISIGIAVTRHGLYEINRVVSRTVSYAIVTALAVGVYALVVTSITWLLPTAPSIAVAAATLAAAAIFLPVLRGVQRLVDRRFDRERYDAEHVVEEFGTRLRSEVDLEETTDALMNAVERTLRPGTVGVWTKAGAS